jgi:mRNA-degrading endonuclease RelE of RelBE toxin-antitoxin system
MVEPVTRFRLWVEPEVHSAREALPGNVRQRVKHIINGLSVEPRPADSRALDVDELDIPENVEIRRLRLDKWRILYAVNNAEGWVWVLEIRKRPPYQYEDLPEIVAKLS